MNVPVRSLARIHSRMTRRLGCTEPSIPCDRPEQPPQAEVISTPFSKTLSAPLSIRLLIDPLSNPLFISTASTIAISITVTITITISITFCSNLGCGSKPAAA